MNPDPTTLTNALMGLILVLITGLVSSLKVQASRTAKKVESVREQVENGHGTNLRDENDRRHAQIMRTLNKTKRIAKRSRKNAKRNSERIARLENGN